MRAKFVNEENFERGRDPKIALDIGLVNKIFKETGKKWQDGGAYSFDAYGAESWKNVIEWLLSQGYTQDETEQVLRSKLMRWASDRASKYGDATVEDFIRYNDEKTRKGKTQVDDFLDSEVRVNEDMGGASAPMGTLGNTPGMGNAQPAGTAATTGSQQGSSSAIGSGDKWDSSIGPMHTQKTNEQNTNPHDKLGTAMAKEMGAESPFEKGSGDQDVKQKKVDEEAINEMNINPHDKLGVAMAKKMGLEIPFKKGKGDKDVEQKIIDIDPDLSSKIMSFEDWEKEFLGPDKNPSILKNKYQ